MNLEHTPHVMDTFDLADLDLDDVRILAVDAAYAMPELGASQPGFWTCCSVVLPETEYTPGPLQVSTTPQGAM